MKRNTSFVLLLLALLMIVTACSLTKEKESEQASATPSLDTGAASTDLPTVVINSPAEGSEVLLNSEVLVYSTARDPKGVTRVELRQDGMVLNTVQSPAPEGQSEFAVLQRWLPDKVGSATLEVIAYRGEVASLPAQVTVTVKAQEAQINIPVQVPTFVVPIPTADLTCRARINIDNLQVTAQPGLAAQQIATVRIGEVYALTGRTGDNAWWELSVNGQRGWVRSIYTILLGDCSDLPVTGEVAAAPTATPTNTPSPTPRPSHTPTVNPLLCRVQVVSPNAPVRNQPSNGAGIILSLAVNSEWLVFQRTADSDWWQIDLAGVLGWIAANDVAIRGECGGVLVATSEVALVNRAPTVDPILPQTLEVGESITVPIVARDPEGASVIVNVTSSDNSIVIASPAGQGISLRAVAEGEANITVSVSDPAGGQGQAVFRVTVSQVPSNQPPVITPIQDLTLLVGERVTIPIRAIDPEGTRVFIAEVRSGSETVAQVEADNQGNLIVRGISAGRVNIEVRLEDGDGGTASTLFAVEVRAPTPTPNQPPFVTPIEGITLLVGEQKTIRVNASDPEGFRPFISVVRSASDQIARAHSDNSGNVIVEGVSAGQVNIQVTVDDGNGGTTTTVFTVTVIVPTDVPNQPPVIEPIPDQSILVGESIEVPIEATDPEGFRPFISAVRSGSSAIARAESDNSGNVVIEGISAGEVIIEVTVDDGNGGVASIAFSVEVIEPTEIPNLPPTVEPIADQRLLVGETVTVEVNASDPEGFRPFIASVISGSDQIARARPDGSGGILIGGVSAGQVNIEVTVDDGTGNTATILFTVTVIAPTESPNQPPIIEPIPDQQVIVGESITIPVNASDPEGFRPFIAEVDSSAISLATAESDDSGNVIVRGITPGVAQITVVVDDSQGGTASVVFRVEIIAPTETPNLPPQIQPIPDQQLVVDERRTIPVNASDPEGFRPFISGIDSSATTIVTAEGDNSGNIVIRGVSPGTAEITVGVDDGSGNTARTTFRVEVLAPTPVPNNPPVVEAIDTQTAPVGETITVPVNASDPEGFNVFIVEVTSASDEIALVTTDNSGNLLVTGVSPGQVEITLTISDSSPAALTTTISFTVIVPEPPTAVPNEPPIIEPIPGQTVGTGEIIIVPLVASDPEGTNVFIAAVVSASDEIARAGSDGRGNVGVEGVSAGEVQITVTVEDGDGSQASTTFNVIVLPPPTTPPNQPPIVEPIPDQTVEVGAEINIPVNASDPEGFRPFIAGTRSDNEAVATVGTNDSGGVIIRGVGPGTATIIIGVTDGQEGVARVSFLVTVPEPPTPVPNQPPVVDPIPDQVVSVGQTITVFVNAFDPEGFRPFISNVTSAADTIAFAQPDGQGNLLLTGVSAGTVQISFLMDDSNGGQTPVTFNVTVPEPPTERPINQAPTIEPIPNQTVVQDQFLPVQVIANDPEGAQLFISVSSSDESIAAAQVQDGGVTVYGASVGNAAITVTVDDGQGGIASAVFGVQVIAPEVASVGSPLENYPVLPEISDGVLQTIQGIYGNHTGSPNVFIVVGDVTPADLLGDASEGGFDLNAVPEVQEVFSLYFNQPLEDGNVLNRGGSRSSNGNWTISDLLDAANNTDDCATLPNPVACGLLFQQPTVAILLVGRNDVLNGTPPEDFARALNEIAQGLAGQGVIPVLVTIPGDPAMVDQYNQAIALVAERNSFPLWNLWRGIPTNQVNGDLTLTSPGGGQNALLTTDNLNNFGTVQRNYQLLLVLNRLRQNVPIN